MDVLAFQRKWIDASQQKERSAYVTHFNDICEVLGVPKPLDADPIPPPGAKRRALGNVLRNKYRASRLPHLV